MWNAQCKMQNLSPAIALRLLLLELFAITFGAHSVPESMSGYVDAWLGAWVMGLGQCVESCSKTVDVAAAAAAATADDVSLVAVQRVENQMSCKENFALKCVLLFPIKLIECVAPQREGEREGEGGERSSLSIYMGCKANCRLCSGLGPRDMLQLIPHIVEPNRTQPQKAIYVLLQLIVDSVTISRPYFSISPLH